MISETRNKKTRFFVKWMLILCIGSGFIHDAPAQYADIPKSTALKVADGIYVHTRWGANLTISSGQDGLLIIDTGYPGQDTYSDSVIRAGFNQPFRYIVNTHYHFDHVAGNQHFARDGAVIAGHINTRLRMQEEFRPPLIPELPDLRFPVIPPFPEEALPELCFTDSMDIHINGDLIRCIHIPGGHSQSDVIVHFMNKNVIHTGDLFLTNMFPPIENTTEGYLDAVQVIIERCDEHTIVIPGHGPISDREGLISFKEMIATASTRIKRLKDKGMSLAEVLDAEPLKELTENGSYTSPAFFIYCVYNNGITY